jgi:hypothetical protein
MDGAVSWSHRPGKEFDTANVSGFMFLKDAKQSVTGNNTKKDRTTLPPRFDTPNDMGERRVLASFSTQGLGRDAPPRCGERER